MKDAPNRLFVYGSLQPGGSNEHELDGIQGEWQRAVVRGKLFESGWGAGLGYPGLVLDPEGGEVPGWVLTSEDLAGRWEALDAFEGEDYRRVQAKVTVEDGETVSAFVYVVQPIAGRRS